MLQPQMKDKVRLTVKLYGVARLRNTEIPEEEQLMISALLKSGFLEFVSISLEPVLWTPGTGLDPKPSTSFCERVSTSVFQEKKPRFAHIK